jgi:hypothetical protein
MNKNPITRSPDHPITRSPDQRIAGSPDRRIAGSPDRLKPHRFVPAAIGFVDSSCFR